MMLIIVRHAQTDWNAQKKMQGQRDNPLNEEGIRQTKELAKALSGTKIDKIYSSDLKRCISTAREIARDRKIEILARAGLREIDLGDMEGKTQEEMKEKHEWYENRKKDKYNSPFPNGESYADVEKRVAPVLKEIQQENRDSTVAIVAHECANRVIIGKLLGLEEKKVEKIIQPQGFIYFIDTETKIIEHGKDRKRHEGLIEKEE